MHHRDVDNGPGRQPDTPAIMHAKPNPGAVRPELTSSPWLPNVLWGLRMLLLGVRWLTIASRRDSSLCTFSHARC